MSHDIFLYLLSCFMFSECIVYHIKTSRNDICPEKTWQCKTLSQLTAQRFHNPNVSLIFLSGNHSLMVQLNISNINVSILSAYSFNAPPTIVCKQNASITMSNIHTVFINYINFIGCHGHKLNKIKWLVIEKCAFTGHRGSALIIFSSNIQIIRTIFDSNSGGSLQDCFLPRNSFYALAGAAIVSKHSSITISECVFEGNTAEVGGAVFAELVSKILVLNTVFERNYAVCTMTCVGGVLYSKNSFISTYNSIFYSNKLVIGEDIYVDLYGGVFGLFGSTLYTENCIFLQNGPNILPNRGHGGVIYAYHTTATVVNCEFRSNHHIVIGGVLSATRAVIIITGSNFTNNTAEGGGAIYLEEGNITMKESMFKYNANAIRCLEANVIIMRSTFEDNVVDGFGGAVFLNGNSIFVSESNFYRNHADLKGGAMHLSFSDVEVLTSLFINNTAGGKDELFFNGGAIAIDACNNVSISGTEFINNRAKLGGAIDISTNRALVILSGNTFVGNSADYGGVLYSVSNINGIIIKLNYDTIKNNSANIGIIYAKDKNRVYIDRTNIRNNLVNQGVIYSLQSTSYLSDSAFAGNQGSLFAYFSNVTLRNVIITSGYDSLKNITVEEGGAITAFESRITFEGKCSLINSYVHKGGGIHASGSKLFVHGRLTIANNIASDSGGGIYLYQSELNCQIQCTLKIINNTANVKGGGTHAISSSVVVENRNGEVIFMKNNANLAGGGICLEVNAKIYILMTIDSIVRIYALTFKANTADYGGAVYVADETNAGTCASESYNIYSTITECFIQALSLQHSNYQNIIVARFTKNYAHLSGSDLFGGLLDRCTISPLTVRNYFRPTYANIVMYFVNISVIQQLNYISSGAVRVCFCTDNEQLDCSYNPYPVEIKKGQNFTVPLVAEDQINNTVPNITIRSYLASSQGGLGENQLNQSTGEGCTNLTYSIFSSQPSERLILYADGPCKDVPLSQRQLEINFTSCDCPIGFQPKMAIKTRCECECSSDLFPYISICDPEMETITREGHFWVNYIKESRGYLIHPYCPHDYCKPSDVRVDINLNEPNGADIQCANNRSGVLCGTCYPIYSLSLGSLRCISCPKRWPAMTALLILVFIIGGVLLVSVLLMLNLTVAVGTFNGIVFYANIVAANSGIVFPPNAFIAWLNLELGFDYCFYDGLDTYWKTWLQLAFPAYVILLIIMVILISRWSTRFCRLIGRRDPVATLATLLLLSYSKLLQTIIASLSATVLNYPEINSTHDAVIVWLPDASIKYLSGKHIPLFIIAFVILLAGIAYTLILFSWQWLLGLKWISSTQKLSLFIQTYQVPYTSNHRYWTGLLLLARIILYIISAANVNSDPRINLTAIGVVIIGILLMRDVVESRGQIYEKHQIEMLETACHFNLAFLCIVSFFTLENTKAKVILTHISISFTAVLFLGVLLYHIFTEIIFKTRLWKNYNSRNRPIHDNVATEASSTSTVPSYSVVERPTGSSLSDSVPKKKEKDRKVSGFDGELKEILLDNTNQYF